MEWRQRDGLRWLEADLNGARVAFSTRLGGTSEAPFDSLNLGLLTNDEPNAVAANRTRLAAALGFAPNHIAFARQVHGARLETHTTSPLHLSLALGGADETPAYGPASAAERARGSRQSLPESTVEEQGSGERGRGDAAMARLPEADGQVVTAPGLAGLVFVADCLPVALRGPGGVAMLHCGWRGLAAGIVAAGAAAVGATEAAIGPGIGPCCYEVGTEVLGAFAGLGDGIAVDRMLDLPEVARQLLAAAGVERVQSAGLCTSCEEGLFFSHRRDAGRSGRQAGLAWLEREGG